MTNSGQVRLGAQEARLAGSYRAMHDAYRERETVFATTMADRTDWEQATASNATWLSPPTPSYAAATQTSGSPHCAQPNLSPPPKPSAMSSPSRGGAARQSRCRIGTRAAFGVAHCDHA